jgi:DNA-binding transcriptional MerR regulator
MDSMTLVRETGITYRQLDYWVRTGLLNGQRDLGSGNARDWTAAQVSKARVMGSLVRAGIGPRLAAELSDRFLADGRAQLAPGLWITREMPALTGGERP